MDDETLARAYREATRGAADAPRPTPEALARAVRREGSESERLETLNAALASHEGQRELALLASVAAAERSERRRYFGGLRVLAIAAGLVAVVTAGLYWKARSNNQEDYRGGTGALELIGATTRADSLLLIWHSLPAAQRYAVEILDRDGRVVLSTQTTDTTATIARPIGTESALRWWVQASTATGTQASAIAPLNDR